MPMNNRVVELFNLTHGLNYLTLKEVFWHFERECI